jgi:hypothetical protein
MQGGGAMSATCSTPVAWEELVAYWANDLDSAVVDRLDEHLIGCETCTAESARASAVIAALRTIIPSFVDHARIEALRARGLRVAENPIRPGSRTPVVFGANTDLLVHKLGGLDLTNAANVGITISVEETGHVIVDEPTIPFDRDSGEVLIACQTHFVSFPKNIVAEVRTRDKTGAERTARYVIPHIFEARPGPQ